MSGEIQFTVGDLDLNAGTRIEVDQAAWAQEHVRMRSDLLARQRDAYARRLLEDRVPQFLHRVLDRPKALKWVLRLWPHWRPTMTVVKLDVTTTAKGARWLAWRWVAETCADGKQVPPGLIFTYTGVSGLPAEIYGACA